MRSFLTTLELLCPLTALLIIFVAPTQAEPIPIAAQTSVCCYQTVEIGMTSVSLAAVGQTDEDVGDDVGGLFSTLADFIAACDGHLVYMQSLSTHESAAAAVANFPLFKPSEKLTINFDLQAILKNGVQLGPGLSMTIWRDDNKNLNVGVGYNNLGWAAYLGIGTLKLPI